MGGRLFAGAGLAFVLMLGGCATTPTAHLSQGKALLISTDALTKLADAADKLAVNGTLKGQAAATVRDDLAKARDATNAANAAYAASDAASAATNAAVVVTLTTDIATILGAAK